MSKRANNWPRIYPRRYPTGRTKWVGDLGSAGGKTRDRRISIPRGAEGYAQQARVARTNLGELPFLLRRLTKPLP